MQFSGTISDVDNALNGMNYSPNGGYSGPGDLQISVTELDGGGQSTSSDVGISVTPTYATPSISVPGGQSVSENSSLTLAAWQGSQVSIGDSLSSNSQVQVSLSVAN